MKELLDTLATWETDGTAGADVGRAVVVRTFGSAPRPEGAVLLYATDGRIAGSVSGGCVEGAAAEEIERARRDGRSRVIRYGISDEEAWDVGLACGGTIDVLIEPAVRAETADAATRLGRAVAIPLPADAPLGRSLGELARGDARWTVYLETRPHPRGTGLRHNTLQGRLHFVDQAEVQRSTGWIFSEWSDTDIVNRFNEFSAAELWLLLDSLA